jgi:hypothetical protein
MLLIDMQSFAQYLTTVGGSGISKDSILLYLLNVYICLTFVMNLGQQIATNSNQEHFDLGVWIADKLGLNPQIEEEKNRLN